MNPRAVLLGGLSVFQNLSMPFTLEIEPPADDVGARAMELAREVGLFESSWSRPVSELGASDRARVRVARALAHNPAVLPFEHASADIPRQAVQSFGAGIRALAERRRVAIVVATVDQEFAGATASRVLNLEPASGRLKDRCQGWLARRLG